MRLLRWRAHYKSGSSFWVTSLQKSNFISLNLGLLPNCMSFCLLSLWLSPVTWSTLPVKLSRSWGEGSRCAGGYLGPQLWASNSSCLPTNILQKQACLRVRQQWVILSNLLFHSSGFCFLPAVPRPAGAKSSTCRAGGRCAVGAHSQPGC